MLTPPLEPGLDRLEEIGELEYHEIDVRGEGWKQAAADITYVDLGGIMSVEKIMASLWCCLCRRRGWMEDGGFIV
jgi:hypothetical protein